MGKTPVASLLRMVNLIRPIVHQRLPLEMRYVVICQDGSSYSPRQKLFTFGSGAPVPKEASQTTPTASDTTKPPGNGKGRGWKSKTQKLTSTVVAFTIAPAVSSPAQAAAITNPAVKTGVKLDQTAVEEAQQRDNTATRALSAAPIKVRLVNILLLSKFIP